MTRHVQEPEARGHADETRVVILGVAASDSHAVANQLIAHGLRELGFTVVNLGTCTPLSEFAEACARYPQAEAVLVGSLNGHIHEDLADLPAARKSGAIPIPVIVGGNLSVGSHKDDSAHERLYALGVDRILTHPDELPGVLAELRETARRRKASTARRSA